MPGGEEGGIPVLAAVVLLILFILLILPVRYTIAMNCSEGLLYTVAAVYGKGMLSFAMEGDAWDKKILLKVLGIEIKGVKGKKVKEEKPLPLGRRICGLTQKKRIYRRMMKAIQEMFKRILLDSTCFRLKVGLGDPGYTGIIAGAVSTFSYCFEDNFLFEPVFSDEPVVDFSAKGVIIPIVPLGIAFKHLLIFTGEELAQKLTGGGS